MSFQRRFWPGNLLIISFCFFLLSTLAQATTVVIPSDDELVIGARAIVRGRVLSVVARYDEQQRMVFTYVTLQVQEVWKGQITSDQIVLKEPGGTAGEFGTLLFGIPEFSRDERVLLYLDTWADGSLRVHQWFLGKFTLVQDSATGTTSAVRAAAGEKVAILGRSSGSGTDRMEVGSYSAMIRARVAANQISSQLNEARFYAATPLRTFPTHFIPVAAGEASAIANFTFLNQVQSPRWFQADSGQVVSFNINTEPAAGGSLPANETSSEIVTDVLNAMNALSSVSGSSLRLASGGSTTSCGLRGNDGNTISFNNCDSHFSATTGCSGIMAAGQITLYSVSNPSVINGTTFFRATEGDVSFNPYMTCAFTDRCNVQEVLTHELGHAVGLGHSSDPDATMSSHAHFDGRCASLRTDDANGIRFIYPSSTTPTPTPTPSPSPTATPTPVPTATPPSGVLIANPNPIRVCDGSGLGAAALPRRACGAHPGPASRGRRDRGYRGRREDARPGCPRAPKRLRAAGRVPRDEPRSARRS